MSSSRPQRVTGEQGLLLDRLRAFARAWTARDWSRSWTPPPRGGAPWAWRPATAKEVITRGGEKVSPVEIDTALLDIPWVPDAGCFSLPRESLGEELAAAVVLAEEAPPDAEALIRARLRERLSYCASTLCRAPPGGTLQRHRLAESALAAGPTNPATSAPAARHWPNSAPARHLARARAGRGDRGSGPRSG